MQWKQDKSIIHSICSDTNFEKYKENEEKEFEADSPANGIYINPI
jgi:hypothetical protein